VRDALIGRAGADVDLATPDPPETVIAKLKRAGLRAVPTGLAHGTVTAIVGARSYEVTTLRRDVETDGRHARVAFTADWRADAERRDFTINALAADPDGAVHDFFDGIADLRAGRVRFVGDADRRLEEDHLRLLRFYRIHAHFGHDAPGEVERAACRRFLPKLSRISIERVRDESLKLLAAEDPRATLRAMAEDGVLAAVLGEARLVTIEELVSLEIRHARVARLRRLAALLPRDATKLRACSERLKLPNAAVARLAATAPHAPATGRPRSLRAAAYADGTEALVDRLLLDAADGAGRDDLANALAIVEGFVRPRFPIGGDDVLALGITGKRVGELLGAVEEWWIADDFVADRSACLAELARRARG
jgi:poly(A) polymerase